MIPEGVQRLVARIVQAEKPERIILFGSHAAGTATADSDVDLLVIACSSLPRRERERRLARQLFGSGVPYDLVVLTPDEVERSLRINGPFVRGILNSGQVLYHSS
jgi:predicted nucleotidyltransferase